MSTKGNTIHRKIKDESQTLRRVSAEEFQNALGLSEPSRLKAHGSPYSVAALRQRLADELGSTGGRPTRREAAVAKRIPLTASEWNMLEEITRLVRLEGLGATPGQVAGVLLHQSMTEVMTRLSRLKTSVSTTVPSAPDLNVQLEEVLAAAASAGEQLAQLRPVAAELLQRIRRGEAGMEVDDGE